MDRIHHLQCLPEEIGKYTLLPGDPGRVAQIASYLDHAEKIAENREYVTYTGSLAGEKVSVVSTGIGGPSAAIAMEELVKLGAHTFLRVGTCGAIQPTLKPGALIIPTAAIRHEGTSSAYLPLEFPAIADFRLVSALERCATALGYQSHTGMVESKDSYYGQHEPESMPTVHDLNRIWSMCQKSGVLASEMECACLFTVATVRHVRCGAVLLLVSNHEQERLTGRPVPTCSEIDRPIRTAVEAMRGLIDAERGTHDEH